MGDSVKRSHLLTLLRLYAQSRKVDSLVGSLDVLLEGPIERRLIPAVRSELASITHSYPLSLSLSLSLSGGREFLQPRHRARFDTLLSSAPSLTLATARRASVDRLSSMPRPLAATRLTQPCPLLIYISVNLLTQRCSLDL